MSLGVGQSLADLDNQSGIDPSEFEADLLISFRQTTGTLEVFKSGILDSEETITSGLPSVPTALRIEYLLDSFTMGSLVNYNVFFNNDEIAFASGTFTWSADRENYLSLSSNLSNDARFDNLVIVGGDLNTIDYIQWSNQFPTAELADGESDFDGDGLSNDEERLFGLNPADSSSTSPFVETLTPSGGFSYTRRSPSLTGFTYLVSTSTDLITWPPDAGARSSVSSTNSNGVETIAVTLSAASMNGQLFVRVEAVD